MKEPKRRLTGEEEELCRTFEQELRLIEAAGIPIFLDGREEDLRTIAEACMVRENGPYSCSYASDENGLRLCFLREEAPPAEKAKKERRMFWWSRRLPGH